jgi:hypothetical protein
MTCIGTAQVPGQLRVDYLDMCFPRLPHVRHVVINPPAQRS